MHPLENLYGTASSAATVDASNF